MWPFEVGEFFENFGANLTNLKLLNNNFCIVLDSCYVNLLQTVKISFDKGVKTEIYNEYF